MVKHQDHQHTTYKVLVRPVLEYDSPLWDHVTAVNVKAPEKVQRWAARWTKMDYRRPACMGTMWEKPSWLKLIQLRKKAHLNTCKFHQGLIHIKSKHNPLPADQTRRNARHTCIPRTSPTTVHLSGHLTDGRPFFPRSILEWNSLHQEVTTTHTPGSFVTSVFSSLKL